MVQRQIKHLGLIPDGARRWARREGKSYIEGYIIAMDLLYEILNFGFEQNILIQSVYALSKENFKRSSSDIEAVYEAGEYFFRKLLPKLSEIWQSNIFIAGDLSLLPLSYRTTLSKSCEASLVYKNTTRKLYFLVAYNPWDEIVDAVSRSQSVDEFRRHLWVKEDLDLVIRTGYGQLISNFLPLQSGYAEFRFISKLFNDVTTADIDEAIKSFLSGGERLFGR